MENRKIVILGAGHVGTHCALSLMFRALANEIVLIDTDEEKAKSQVLDLDDIDRKSTRLNSSHNA